MKVNDQVEALYQKDDYVRGVLISMDSDQARVRITEIAGMKRVFRRVQPFEANFPVSYVYPLKPA